jgi:hypothetical protein
MIGSMRTSGRVMVSAAAIMVAVVLTFALSGHLAPKEMGVILAVAVAVDATRLLLLPAILRLGGHRIWRRSAWLGRFIGGPIQPLRARGGTGGAVGDPVALGGFVALPSRPAADSLERWPRPTA